MFNFFDEIKKSEKIFKNAIFDSYNLVNVSGKILYAEGITSLLTLSKTLVFFKTKSATISVEGENLTLDELSQNTIKIVGKIKKVEEV